MHNYFKDDVTITSQDVDSSMTLNTPAYLAGVLQPIIFSILFILFAYAILLVEYMTPYFYNHLFGTFNVREMASLIYLLGHSIICYFLLPYTLAIYILKFKPTDIGLVFPKINSRNILLTLLASLLLVPSIYFFSLIPAMQSKYSLSGLGLPAFLLIQFIFLPIYYFVEEFFFRGFLFLTLWRWIGWHSFWITDVMFTFAHLTKPIPELLLCIPASIVLSYLALKSKSLYPAFLVHLGMGLLLNFLVYFR